jgi:hypothetical protein
MRAIALASLLCLLVPASGFAASCANGVYRAGCVGPNGAAVVRKPYPYRPPVPAYHPPPAPRATCANGVYRAGCVGPNGAVVRYK